MMEKGLKASSFPIYRLHQETTNAKKISIFKHYLTTQDLFFRSASGYKRVLKKESFRAECKMFDGFQS